MSREIEIIIDEDGNITAEGVAFDGDACDIAMKRAIDGLGTVVSDKKKPEFYRRKTKNPNVKVGG